jgi:uncharacterized protein (TIGR00369 family)
MSDAKAPPVGFAEMQRKGEYWRMSGPYFGRARDGGADQAFFADARHCNAQGFVHGGMLSAFLDGLLSQAVRLATHDPTVVTLHLSVDFLATARKDEWVIGESLVTRQTRDVVFVEGRLHSGGRDVVRGSGLFKPTRPAES